MPPAPPALTVRSPQPTHKSRLLRLAAAALVVALVAVIAAVAAITVRQEDRIADLEAHDRIIFAVVTTPDAQPKVRELDGVTAISLSTETHGSNMPTSDPILTASMS
jgi:hypothetical protein